jgi:centriolar protein POC1
MVASGSDDRTVKLWDVAHQSLVHTFTDHTGMVSNVAFHPDGTCLASCATDKKIKIFDSRSQRLLQHYDAHSDVVNTVSFHSSGSYLVSTSNDATVKIWDLRKGQILYTLYGHEGPTTTATFSPLGDFLLTGGQDANIVVWTTNLNEKRNEELYGISVAKVETDIFVTDKAEVKKLPQEQPKRKNPAVNSSNQSQGQEIHPDVKSTTFTKPPLRGAPAQ